MNWAAQLGDAKGVRDDDPIVIGLVNNMSDAALRTTEQQFRLLLAKAPPGRSLLFRLFFLPEIARSEAARRHFMQHYEPIDTLWTSRIDGLIVTGAEPRTPLLTDEVYWDTLTKLVDWAQKHTVSTIWSCLAAHATVRHLDGIDRQALEKKLFGVFDCHKVADHPILTGVPSQWQVPHSRFNGLPEDLLSARGYLLMSRSAEAGPDVFLRDQGSLFVFLNGHPEYHPDALFREYRRDVIRFLSGEQDCYPDLPNGYFDISTTQRLEAFRGRAIQCRNPDLAADLPARGSAGERLPHTWHDVAALIFTNWLSYLAATRLQSSPGPVPELITVYPPKIVLSDTKSRP